MAKEYRAIRAAPVTFLAQMADEYGDMVAFPVPGTATVLLNNPRDVRQVLQQSARNWTKRTVQYASLIRVTGPGLLASSEPSWLEHRRVAAPAFHHQRLIAIGDQVRSAAADELAGLPRESEDADDVIDVVHLMHRVALDAVGKALFSADLSESGNDLLRLTGGAAELVVKLGSSLLPTATWTPTRTNHRLRRTRRRMAAITAELIAQRRRRRASSSGHEQHGDDLLGLMLDAGFSDQEINDELITMVIAGHETVAAALSWTLMLLAENQDVQDAVRAELRDRSELVSMLAGRDALPLTHAVLEESLRLYPPAWAVSRRSIAAEEVGGVMLPAGSLAIISPWTLHRRSEQWSGPAEFDPERFRPDGPPRLGYAPFGLGPHLCIGRGFAIGEMVVVLAEVLRCTRVSVTPGWTRPEPSARLTLQPTGGMWLRVSSVAGG